MAIALLNFADDKGFFHADPILVRNFCRPFDDDSTTTRRTLDELSRSGWIEVAECDAFTGGVGRIVNFQDHQRIDRPNPSKIERYFDSTKIRRVLDDQSTLEGKGREGKGKKTPTEVAVTDNLLHKVLESFLSEGRFANYQKETVCAKAIIKSVRNLSPENPEKAAELLLVTFRQLVHGTDKFWAGQPFLPLGLSPLVERVWAEAIKTHRGQDTGWLERLRNGQS